MSQLPPPRPDHMPERPEFPRSSRYNRRKHLVSWWGLIIGLLLGVGGGLAYAWLLSPVVETDTAPRQLNRTAKAHYTVAIALSFAENSDLGLAIQRLTTLELGVDPLTEVAVIACDLARSGYVDSDAGLQAVRSLKTFYQLQGRTGCADTLVPDIQTERVVEIEVPTPTATLPPPPTKTPTITVADNAATQASVLIVPTNTPNRQFSGSVSGTFCEVERSGWVVVNVTTFDGQGIPGQVVRARWDGGEDRFASGLKPAFGQGYADFEMESGRNYTIDMPGQADPITAEIVARPCTTETGEQAITGYRVVFRQVG